MKTLFKFAFLIAVVLIVLAFIGVEPLKSLKDDVVSRVASVTSSLRYTVTMPFTAQVSSAYLDKENLTVKISVTIIATGQTELNKWYTICSASDDSFALSMKFVSIGDRGTFFDIPLSEQDSDDFMSKHVSDYKELRQLIKEIPLLFEEWLEKDDLARNATYQDMKDEVLRGKGSVSFLDVQLALHEEADQAEMLWRTKTRRAEQLLATIGFPDFSQQYVDASPYIYVTETSNESG